MSEKSKRPILHVHWQTYLVLLISAGLLIRQILVSKDSGDIIDQGLRWSGFASAGFGWSVFLFGFAVLSESLLRRREARKP